MQIKRALISVSNKEGVVEFARQLHEAVLEGEAGGHAAPKVLLPAALVETQPKQRHHEAAAWP